MTTTSTTPVPRAYGLVRHFQEHCRCILDSRGVPMIQADTGGAVVGVLAVQMMRFIYPWVDESMRADIRKILRTLGYVVPPEATPRSLGSAVTTEPDFGRFADVLEWLARMSRTFGKLSKECPLGGLDHTVDDEVVDQLIGDVEIDRCADRYKKEYFRDVRRNATPVLDALRSMAHDLQRAIGFLEARCTVAGD
jgi:hypothetical protein